MAVDARTFPFSAIVGSDDLALALILTTVSPEVGGVLVRGEKGTAKTTMVRALAHVLPALDVVEHCRFSCHPDQPDPLCPDGPHPPNQATTRPARLVELPVGASEDRVIGALDLQQALGSGQVHYQPGLLAAAHRGILYVDEVNLLHDHLVDLLLDAAATGRSTVEREGVSVSHASRIVLIGTMNPEEGELRPQLLDRFGLTVEIAAPRDPELRAEVVRRRMAFDADPGHFAEDLRRGRADPTAADRHRPRAAAHGRAERRPADHHRHASARRSRWTACAPISSPPAPPPPTRPGRAGRRSRRPTSGPRPGSPSPTVAAGTRSTPQAWTRTSLTSCWPTMQPTPTRRLPDPARTPPLTPTPTPPPTCQSLSEL